MDRSDAEAILHEFTKNKNLRKHALCVEAVMRTYAKKFGEDENLWGVVGLLHDFDYEIHPTIEKHPQDGSAILRKKGVSEEIIHAILAHAPHTGEPRDTLLKKTIFAADELAGFVVAVALVRPNKKLSEVTPESVVKKLKSPAFAASVNREEIYEGVKELGITLEEHAGNVISALQDISEELGL